jgi:hypothetical protein
MVGAKDSIPALVLEARISETLLDRVLPKPKPVEISSSDQHGPVLILDMVGAQEFIPPQLEVIDGEVVGINEASVHAERNEGGPEREVRAEQGDDSESRLEADRLFD